MPDNFESMSGGLESPAERSFVIAPHATEPLAFTTRAVFVGGAGNLTVRFAGDDDDRTLTGLLAGVVYPFRLTHVRASGATASALVGLD